MRMIIGLDQYDDDDDDADDDNCQTENAELYRCSIVLRLLNITTCARSIEHLGY
jgi:hypothetical protein